MAKVCYCRVYARICIVHYFVRCHTFNSLFRTSIAWALDSSGVCFEEELREAIKTVLGRHADKRDDQVVNIRIGVGASPDIQILFETPESPDSEVGQIIVNTAIDYITATKSNSLNFLYSLELTTVLPRLPLHLQWQTIIPA